MGIPWQTWLWYGFTGLALSGAATLAALRANRRQR
jgi:hypothetical protein